MGANRREGKAALPAAHRLCSRWVNSFPLLNCCLGLYSRINSTRVPTTKWGVLKIIWRTTFRNSAPRVGIKGRCLCAFILLFVCSHAAQQSLLWLASFMIKNTTTFFFLLRITLWFCMSIWVTSRQEAALQQRVARQGFTCISKLQLRRV